METPSAGLAAARAAAATAVALPARRPASTEPPPAGHAAARAAAAALASGLWAAPWLRQLSSGPALGELSPRELSMALWALARLPGLAGCVPFGLLDGLVAR